MFKSILCTLFVLIVIIPKAQDSHYWTQQYGPRSALLGGAVVGGVRDNSAIYYNPGALAFNDTITISISANGYQLDHLTLKDGAGTGLNLNSLQTQIIPLIVTGMYRLKKLPRHTFGYAILSKDQTGMKFSARIDSRLNVIADSNSIGNEEFIGQYSLKARLDEQWFGGAYAYKINDHVSAGFSGFVANRTQSLERSHIAKVIPDFFSFYSSYIAEQVSYSEVLTADYNHIRAFGKFGLAFDFKKIKFGIAFTTSSIGLYGTGTVMRDESVYNLNLNNNNLTTYTLGAVSENQLVIKTDSFKTDLDNYTINDRQSTANKEMKVNYRSPWSLSFGFETTGERGRFCFSAEYFSTIKPYDVVRPVKREVIRPRNASFGLTTSEFIRFNEGSGSVFNFAIAYEYSMTKKLDLLASYRSNYSKDYPGDNPDLLFTQTFWDIHHYTLGVKYKQKKSDVSIGLAYAMANSEYSQFVNMSEPNEASFLDGDWKEIPVKFRSYSLILGYTYYLK